MLSTQKSRVVKGLYYIQQCCQHQIDTKEFRCRVILNELYDDYIKKVKYSLPLEGFKQYIIEVSKLPVKNATWYHDTKLTVFNICPYNHVYKKQRLIEDLIRTFVDEKCDKGDCYVEDTCVL